MKIDSIGGAGCAIGTALSSRLHVMAIDSNDMAGKDKQVNDAFVALQFALLQKAIKCRSMGAGPTDDVMRRWREVGSSSDFFLSQSI